MNWFYNMIVGVNWIQVLISLLSALIVAIYSSRVTTKRYFDQQWWNKRIEVYEEIISILSKLEHLYDEWVDEIELGIRRETKLKNRHGELLIKVKEIMFSSEFYADVLSVQTLKELNATIDNTSFEWGNNTTNSLDLIDGVRRKVIESKEKIIIYAGNELKLKK